MVQMIKEYWIILDIYLEMLLKDTVSMTLNPPMQKILCVSSAYNQTIVVVRLDKPGQAESIVHLSPDGKILWEHNYKDIINFFAMISEKEVIVLNVPEARIDIINLESQKIKSVNHDFLFDDVAQMTIETFAETRLFCVKEQGGFSDHRMRLTYYAFDGINAESKPQTSWQSKDNEWTYDHMTRKGNCHSKIIWWNYKHEADITFTYFDLRDDPKGKMQMVKCKNTVGVEYGLQNTIVGIGGLWETIPNVYMVVASTSKSENKNKDKNGVVNNNFIIDASSSQELAIIRETKFVFQITEDGFSYNDQLIQFYRLGSVSVFYSFRHEKGEALETPIYFVSNATEEIVAHDKWKCSCYRNNFFWPGWDANTVVVAEHVNGDVENLTVDTLKIMDHKEISMHFLLQLNDDFDDDLLQDAIDLLH